MPKVRGVDGGPSVPEWTVRGGVRRRRRTVGTVGTVWRQRVSLRGVGRLGCFVGGVASFWARDRGVSLGL